MFYVSSRVCACVTVSVIARPCVFRVIPTVRVTLIAPKVTKTCAAALLQYSRGMGQSVTRYHPVSQTPLPFPCPALRSSARPVVRIPCGRTGRLRYPSRGGSRYGRQVIDGHPARIRAKRIRFSCSPSCRSPCSRYGNDQPAGGVEQEISLREDFADVRLTGHRTSNADAFRPSSLYETRHWTRRSIRFPRTGTA